LVTRALPTAGGSSTVKATAACSSSRARPRRSLERRGRNRAIDEERFPEPVRVRMGVHTGEAIMVGEVVSQAGRQHLNAVGELLHQRRRALPLRVQLPTRQAPRLCGSAGHVQDRVRLFRLVLQYPEGLTGGDNQQIHFATSSFLLDLIHHGKGTVSSGPDH